MTCGARPAGGRTVVGRPCPGRGEWAPGATRKNQGGNAARVPRKNSDGCLCVLRVGSRRAATTLVSPLVRDSRVCWSINRFCELVGVPRAFGGHGSSTTAIEYTSLSTPTQSTMSGLASPLTSVRASARSARKMWSNFIADSSSGAWTMKYSRLAGPPPSRSV
jgi:hypothetical protein